MESPLLNKSLEFATQIVLFYEEYSKSKRDTTIAKQLLRSATSVGANINEAIYWNSKPDFISKLHFSLKEVSESIYWLILLRNTKLFEYNYDDSIKLAEEIKRMLISSINTAKKNNKWMHHIIVLPCQKSTRFVRVLSILLITYSLFTIP